LRGYAPLRAFPDGCSASELRLNSNLLCATRAGISQSPKTWKRGNICQFGSSSCWLPSWT